MSAIQAAIRELRSRGFLRLPPEIYSARLAAYLAAARSTALHRIALPGACRIVAAWSLLRIGRRSPWFITAMFLEVFGFGLGYVVSVPARRIPAEPPAVEAVKRLDPGQRWRIAAGPEIYPPNLATLHGLRDIRSYDLLETREWVAAMRSLEYNFPARAFRLPLSEKQKEKLGQAGVRYLLSRDPIPGARWVGGDAPPAVGAYELARASPSSKPPNTPPDGLGAGLIVSLSALLLTVLMLLLAPGSARKEDNPADRVARQPVSSIGAPG